MKQYTLYKITSGESLKSYIGYTVLNFNQRWNQHLKSALLGSNTHFHKAIRKYNITSWTFELLEIGYMTHALACQKEKEYIEKYNTFYTGYNMTLGGDGGNSLLLKSQEEKININLKKRKTRIKNFGNLKWTENNYLAWANKSEEEKQKIKYLKSSSMKKKENHGELVSKGHSYRSVDSKILTAQKLSKLVKFSFEKRKQNKEQWQKYIETLKQRTSKKVQTPFGQFDSLKAAVEYSGIPNSTLRRKIKSHEFKDYYYI